MSKIMITYKPWIQVSVTESTYPYYNENRFVSYDPDFIESATDPLKPMTFIRNGFEPGDHRVKVELSEVTCAAQFHELVEEYCPAMHREQVKHAFRCIEGDEEDDGITYTYILFTGEREERK